MKELFSLTSSTLVEGLRDLFNGERELLRAIISLAIRDVLEPTSWNKTKRNPYRDCISAKEWLFESVTEPLVPFSFAWMCEHISVESDPQLLRSAILKRVEELLEEKASSRRAA